MDAKRAENGWGVVMNQQVSLSDKKKVFTNPPHIVSVGEVLSDPSLTIPEYQRPYKWVTKHVEQLFEDIARHKNKSAYRLGTLVLHRHRLSVNTPYINDIVDGQQRTITLLLIVKAILAECLNKIHGEELKTRLTSLKKQMFNPEFTNAISQYNIRHNYNTIRRRVSRPEFDEGQINFLLNHCELVLVTLDDITEAFQFFDAQNARGRDLAPHDLLKAFHLREFSEVDQPLKQKTVFTWENSESDDLEELFGEYLYRIRRWVKGKSARIFGKDDVSLFKGVNLAQSLHYPFVSGLRIAHHTVDDYNTHFSRHLDGQAMSYPFQLDQVIVNGRRFFEMITHYQNKLSECDSQNLMKQNQLDENAAEILNKLNSYAGRHRTGDTYVRTIFDCLLLFYIDKFGFIELSRAIEKIFIWAYSLRFDYQVLQLASVDNYVLSKNMFRLISDITDHQTFLQTELPIVKKVNSSRTEALERLFMEMKYLDVSA